jgi:2'-5' RNA ligase
MESRLVQKLADKSLTKDQLLEKVRHNYDLIPELLSGTSSSKPTIRYGCGKILMDLSEEKPEKLYPYMDFFINLLESKYRILTWNAISIIANLTKIDKENKFDIIFEKYYSFLDNEYMVTVANVVGNSGKIALAKPHLTQKITDKLLTVENISTTPHLSEECKRVITEHAIKSFDMFFPQIKQKDKVISFVKKHLNSSRKTLRIESENFLKKWDQSV